MKALRILGSMFLGLIMLICLGIFSGLMVFRISLSGQTLGKIAMEMVENNNDLDLDSFYNDLNLDQTELDGLLEDLDDYVSREEIYQQVGDLSSQMLKYQAGVIDKIDATDFKAFLKKVAKEYEKKTGEDIDIDDIDDIIDEAVEDMEDDVRADESFPTEVTQLFKTAYSNGPLITCAVVFIICALLIVLINKSVAPLFLHLFIVCLINGLVNGLIGGALNALLKASVDDESALVVMSAINGVFGKIALACIIVAIVSLVLFIVLKAKKKNEPVQQVPVQPQGDVIDQIRATSMMPDQPNNTFNNNPNDPNNNNFNQ